MAREILKSPDVEKITIVDLDGAVFKIATENPYVTTVNKEALLNPKVKMVESDAFTYLNQDTDYYDIIISDLPDPSNDAIARLYSDSFFKLVKMRLSKYGVFATQATSPFHSKNAYWCIAKTIDSVFENIYPYHQYVPSFGDWGFVMASNFPMEPTKFDSSFETRFLDSVIVEKMFYFGQDIRCPENLKINKLDSPELLDYYLKDWEIWRKEKKQ